MYGLNTAKSSSTEKIIVVEGYMDTVSLYQRGVANAVASLGTALTEAQGRLLRKYSEKVIIAYDSDSAGQAATLRGLEILSNLGCDVRILQMEGAKDPDEFIIKYGNAKFNALVENAVSLVEFKVKMLRGSLNIEAANDKIKFLNETAKILSNADNKMEQEVYIDKIAKEYDISKEAIYAEINKLNYSKAAGGKVLQKPAGANSVRLQTDENIPKSILEREELALALLINYEAEAYNKIKDKILPDDFKSEKNKKIIQKLYEELKKGNININGVIDFFKEDEEVVGKLTKIMAKDYEIKDKDKAVTDILNAYEKEKLIKRRDEILRTFSTNNEEELLKELQEINIKLTKL
ncbi:MAG: toprim domain-containing protein [Firmicutes bacterium]|nr:toprim domain-containing protein [Bacillota bacterium]